MDKAAAAVLLLAILLSCGTRSVQDPVLNERDPEILVSLALDTGEPPALRTAALEQLTLLEDWRALRSLSVLLTDSRSEIRLWIAEALAHDPSPDVLPLLTEGLVSNYRDEIVRHRLLQGIALHLDAIEEQGDLRLRLGITLTAVLGLPVLDPDTEALASLVSRRAADFETRLAVLEIMIDEGDDNMLRSSVHGVFNRLRREAPSADRLERMFVLLEAAAARAVWPLDRDIVHLCAELGNSRCGPVLLSISVQDDPALEDLRAWALDRIGASQ